MTNAFDGPGVPVVARRIATVRNQRVILDSDLAELYGVETRVLLQAVRRNAGRFPRDFLFHLSNQDVAALRSQTVMSNRTRRGGRSYSPYAFTEHGAIMAATVLNSPRAIEMSVYVVRAFIKLRETLATHKEFAKRLDELERRVGTHDRALAEILQTVRQLMAPVEPLRKRGIGFVRED